MTAVHLFLAALRGEEDAIQRARIVARRLPEVRAL
jgi:hypothetical protein